MHPKCGPKEGHCKETYKYSIKRVKYARYMRTKFRSQQFFTVKRQFSPFASRVWHPLAFMHSKCGPKEGHCKETYRNSIKRVKYASYMRTKFRSLQFFTVKRLFSHIERRKQSFRHPWQFKMQIPETEAPSITCTEHLSTFSHTI